MSMMKWNIWHKLTRKKSLDDVVTTTPLRRCLSAFDLTLMGIGAMIGSGIYVMTGKVIKEQAGPGIVLSFILAAVIILMVAGCFTEFAARVNHTGSTYLYVYLSLGELPAFLVGFVSICVIILGGATNARAWSGYLDSLFNGTISNFTRSHLDEWTIGSPVSKYPDVLAMVLVSFITLIIALGAKCSSWFNSLFALINIAILTFVTIVGFLYADTDNWTSKVQGGFLPHGFSGVLSGAAVCFWAFSGFEILSCAVEEAHNPQRDIAIATVASVVVVTILYVGTTAALTIMTPYSDIDITAPLPTAFAARGLYWAQVVASLGPLCGLTTTLVSSLYSFVRITYKISEDGLLFGFLSHVNDCSKVPVLSVLICGSMTAVTALFLDLSELISFSVTLILMSYCLVCGGVIILRYRPQTESVATTALTGATDAKQRSGVVSAGNSNSTKFVISDPASLTSEINNEFELNELNESEQERLLSQDSDQDIHSTRIGNDGFRRAHQSDQYCVGQLKTNFIWLWPCRRLPPGRWPCLAVFIMCLTTMVAALIIVYHSGSLLHESWWMILLLLISLLVLFLLLGTIYMHHQSTKGLPIKMPCVPLMPSFSMIVCLYLLVATATFSSWVGCGVLLALGLAIYFTYSIRHSKLNQVGYHALQNDSPDEEGSIPLTELGSENDLNSAGVNNL